MAAAEAVRQARRPRSRIGRDRRPVGPQPRCPLERRVRPRGGDRSPGRRRGRGGQLGAARDARDHGDPADPDLLLHPGDRGPSGGRRCLRGRQGVPRPLAGAARCRVAGRRLRVDGGRQPRSRRREPRQHLPVPLPSSLGGRAHRPRAADDREHVRDLRVGQALDAAGRGVRHLDAGGDRRRRLPSPPQGSDRDQGGVPRDDCRRCVAASQGVRQRRHGDHRGGGNRQQRARLPRTAGAQCSANRARARGAADDHAARAHDCHSRPPCRATRRRDDPRPGDRRRVRQGGHVLRREPVDRACARPSCEHELRWPARADEPAGERPPSAAPVLSPGRAAGVPLRDCRARLGRGPAARGGRCNRPSG